MAAIYTIPVFIICVITGNSLFAVVPKLGQKYLLEINLKKLFLIQQKNQNFRS
jgi:hypothetical protein